MFTFGRIKDKVVAVLSLLARQRKIRRGSAAVLFLLLLTLILSVDFFPNEANLQVGQVSPRTFYADKSIVFEDKNKTAEQRRLAAEKVEKVYVKDPQVIIGVQRDISDVAGTLREVQGDESLDKNAKIEKLKEILPFNLNDADLEKLAESSPDYTQQVENSLKGLIALSMEEGDGITQDSLEEDERDIVNQIIRMSLPQHYENLAISIIELYLRPNAFVDYEMTRQKQEEAMASVAPTMITVKEGEKIIGEGEIVSEEHLVKLQALGLTRTKLPWTSVMGIFLLTVMLTVLVLFYLYQQNREIYEHPGHIYLLGIIVITVLAVGKAIIAINVSQWPEFGAQFGYMVPLAAAGMLIAILLDSRLAVLVVAVMSFMLAIMTDYQLRFGLVGLIGGITGVYSVSKLSQRGDLVRAGFYTSGANVVAIFIVGLVTGTPLGLLISTSLALGITSGILSSILTNGSLPFLEHTFQITSPVRLLELSHPNNVLLKKLLTEAPGTYHHSIIVGNLAEAAADAVGGESLLVRVGAYYHDIGKLKRPYFFIENQMGCDNPHDKIAPSLSTLILTSHVKDGVEMAREHKLPQRIIDIIEQHHGSGLVSYFYHKALENDRSETVTEEEFRYEGPKPQTKEAALVMLADSVEAAVRSLQNRTAGRIEGLVRKIIKDKLNDGQLDECDLTLKDLDIIASAFVRVLTGIFHNRIEYPDMAQEMERRKKRVSTRKQLAEKNSG
ncbi:MAG TPA: HDIG domain-containing protein [Bacillota bacterium]|jgi:putative nucleotidyltransferase with HDIG domain|nr:HDIG domain-containing protein [Peptococcaceae bacterium MAG4]NLW37371.1 HDIG domain-containing protein [Peptococcaceae bacterium]HPZ43860.1 HDIG domain-containing protein [Bacillota bacterium]HQD76361.1 HDIG domain-containing protein [Bacillota bacterium]HUM59049.1 HDIG domain-containing protein [Bacillota bacterium]